MSGLWTNHGVRWVTTGWTCFILENLVMSHNREEIIGVLGDDQYHFLYNALSTLTCGTIAFGLYKHGRTGPLMTKSPALRATGVAVQALGVVGLSQLAPAVQVPVWFGSSQKPTNANGIQSASAVEGPERKLYVRCPIDFRAKSPTGDLYGVERVSRHTALWSLGLTAFGGALYTLSPACHVAGGFFLLFSGIGSAHTDYRYRRGNGGVLTPEMEQRTSNVPFAALLRGRQRWQDLVNEMKWTNAAAAVVATLLFAANRIK